eukprot:gene35969-43624_t
MTDLLTNFSPGRSPGTCNQTPPQLGHRSSCHRCGNLRVKIFLCPMCPQVFCVRCYEKMLEEHGPEVFFNGCPMCKRLCCCFNKEIHCTKTFHCYKKCRIYKQKISFGYIQVDSPLAKLAEVCSVAPRLDTNVSLRCQEFSPDQNLEGFSDFGEHSSASETKPCAAAAALEDMSPVAPTGRKRGCANMVSASKKPKYGDFSDRVIEPLPSPISANAAAGATFSVPESMHLNMEEVLASYSPGEYSSPHSTMTYSPTALPSSVSSNLHSSGSSLFAYSPSPALSDSSITPLTHPMEKSYPFSPFSSVYSADTWNGPYWTRATGAFGSEVGLGFGTVGCHPVHTPPRHKKARLPRLPFAIDVFSGEDPLIMRPFRPWAPAVLPPPSPVTLSDPAQTRVKSAGKLSPPKAVEASPAQHSSPLFSPRNFRGQMTVATTSSNSDAFAIPSSESVSNILIPMDFTEFTQFSDPSPPPTGYEDLQELLDDFLMEEDLIEKDLLEGEYGAIRPAGLSDAEVASAQAFFGDDLENSEPSCGI